MKKRQKEKRTQRPSKSSPCFLKAPIKYYKNSILSSIGG